MLIAVIAFFTMLALLDRYTRLGRIEQLALDTRYKLFSLRDILRSSAISGDVDPNCWLFDYLDTSLTRAAEWLPNLTAFEVIGDMISMDRVEARRRIEMLQAELAKPENHRFQAIFMGYQGCLRSFLSGRHLAASFLGRRLVSLVGKLSSCTNHDVEQRKIQAVAADPDTSTLDQYCKPGLARA
jgi:hypothetical protein